MQLLGDSSKNSENSENSHGMLGALFQIVRLFQAASLIAAIGMAANFVAEMINANTTPPNILIGVLSVVCVAVLYCIMTFILYLDNRLPFLVNAVIDGLLLVALIVVTVLVGKPLSYLNCSLVGKTNPFTSDALTFATSVNLFLDRTTGTVVFNDFIGAAKSICLEMKAIWGLSIALCILFTLTCVTSIVLWRDTRTPGDKDKSEA